MTVNGERYLNAAAAELAWAQSVIRDRVRSVATITRDGWPARTPTAGPVAATGTTRVVDPANPASWDPPDYSDPTGEAVVGRDRQAGFIAELDRLAAVAWQASKALAEHLGRAPTPPVDTSQDASRARCDGGAGEWADPTCEALAVRSNVRVEGVDHELCWRCLKRGQRHMSKISAPHP